MSRLEFAQNKDLESIGSALAFKVFLLEREVGYQITKDMNGIMVMERLRMLDRYWIQQNKAQEKSNTKGNQKSDKLLKR